jgi:hypothetical protein
MLLLPKRKNHRKKLKILGVLHVISAQRGKISVLDFIAQCNDDINPANNEQLVQAGFGTVVTDCDNEINISDSECKSLIFVGGYVGFKIDKTKVNCILFQNELITEHVLEVDFVASGEYTYLWDLDRGGLKWPTDFLVEVVTQVYLVFRCIVSPVYEAKFLEQSNNKSIIVGLSMERLQMLGLLEGECISL